ncbi:sigma 54-interacting transcriptional regulator [Brassicibacter mesophilus]|uniref:sigma 54-interacting transcriptional regulator n=1 Tax=Brassicibacter mesophilus TaxID=745119 RepID=UPI003D23FA90
MEFEIFKVDDILVHEIMKKDIFKINILDVGQNLVDIILKNYNKKVIVFEMQNEIEVVKSIVDATDVLKMNNEKISLEDYLKTSDSKLHIPVNKNDTVRAAFRVMIETHAKYLPVESADKIIGIIGIDEILNSKINIFNNNSDILLKILDDINVAISVVDVNLITRFWNKSAEKMYEISKKEILDKPITNFFPSALLPKVIKEGKPYKNVYNSPRNNCYNIISATPLYEGEKLIGGIGYDRDISELMRLSELLNKTQLNLKILEQEVSKLNESECSFSQIVGDNEDFKRVISLAKSVAKSNISILLTGESGTGKEVFARAIHIESVRKGYFVPINCSAIPEELMESELFGYEKGAFTGASKEGKAGKFELANNGTLFLDEIGDMSLSMQPKILRVLEDGIITRVGSGKHVKVDVRIIAATNKDIKKMVSEGTFRKDLYYRLNSVLIKLPSLRDRKDDVPELVLKFSEEFCTKYGTNIKEIDTNLMMKLINYDWEGNVRELRNIVEIMIILAKNNKKERLDASLLPESFFAQSSNSNLQDYSYSLDLKTITESAEIEAISKAMKLSHGNKTYAANLLNIPRSTLYFKLDKYKINI